MKQRNKLSVTEQAKIRARFNKKCEEYELLTIDELKDLYVKTKMSNTDRRALLYTAGLKKQQIAIDNSKVINNTEVIKEKLEDDGN